MHNWIGRHFLTLLSLDATGQRHGDTPWVPAPAHLHLLLHNPAPSPAELLIAQSPFTTLTALTQSKQKPSLFTIPPERKDAPRSSLLLFTLFECKLEEETLL